MELKEHNISSTEESKLKKQRKRNPFKVDRKAEKEKRRVRRSRIIVRNISYKATEESLKEFFSQFGTINELNLLKRQDGKLVGCAFIQYEKVNEAAKAILKATNKEYLGRPVFVDWALGKDEYKKKNAVTPTDRPKDNEIKEEITKESMEEVNSDADIDSDANIDTKSQSSHEGKDEYDSDSEEQQLDDSMDSDELDSDEDKKKIKIEKLGISEPRKVSNDVKEGCTIFIKNIPFDATDIDIRKCCRKFGPIYYALINTDHVSGHSKGTAFVKFKTKESADLCLNAGDEFEVMGEVLEPHPALSRDEVRSKSEAGKSRDHSDSRNLYLIKEGLIMANSKAAEGVSASDMAKRHKLEQIKTQILKNLNRFVSRNRLSIHNLPFSYDDEKLRELIVKHTKLVPHECRVMRENKPSAGNPGGKSKGFGFMSFKTHEQALAALRKLNNNPNINGATNRPIVSFSIEDRSVHNIKEKRLQKSRDNNPTYKDKLERNKELKQAKKLNRKDSKSDIKKPRELENASHITDDKKIEDENQDGFAGFSAKPGTFNKMRSNKKLREQSQTHKKNMSEIKRKGKAKKERILHRIEKSQVDRTKAKKKIAQTDNFSFLVDKYKRLIDTKANSEIVKSKRSKWYTD